MKKIDVSRYASELLFHASVANPWEVSESEFVAIVSMLTDGSKLTPEEREDVTCFLQCAVDVAESVANGRQPGRGRWTRRPKTCEARGASPNQIYRDACRSAQTRGYPTHGDRASSPL